MPKRPKLRELIARAKDGEEEALALLLERVLPIVKKHGQRMGYDGAYSDLILWMINTIRHYRPNTNLDEEEIECTLLNKRDKKKIINKFLQGGY